MATPKAKHVIYTVELANFTVGGESYNVSTVSLELAKNEVPICAVGIAPEESDWSSTFDEHITKVNVFSIEKLKGLYDRFIEKTLEPIDSGSRLSSLMVVINGLDSGGGKIQQTLNLHGWILIGAGLSRVTTTSPFHLECYIAHPSYKLKLYEGFFFNGKNAIPFDRYESQATDPIAAGKAAIEAIQEANEKESITTLCMDASSLSTPLKSVDEMNKDIADHIEKAKQNMELYLEWKGDDNDGGEGPGTYTKGSWDLPCEQYLTLEHQKSGVRYSMLTEWGNSRCSVWDSLVSDICPYLSLEVIPTFWKDKLPVVPAHPWRELYFSIYGADTSEVIFPGKDRDPVYGCVIIEGKGLTESGGMYTVADSVGCKTMIQPLNLSFIPKSESDTEGRLIHCGRPAWIGVSLDHGSSFATTENELGDSPPDDFNDELYEPTKKESGENKDLTTWDTCTVCYLGSVFMNEYKKTVTASLACAFMVRDFNKNEYVIPGKRVAFVSGEKTMFTGMITTVHHYIDCAKSIASTNIKLAYCTYLGADEKLLGNTPSNPMWDDKQNIEVTAPPEEKPSMDVQ
jgi:hypothetical protein